MHVWVVSNSGATGNCCACVLGHVCSEMCGGMLWPPVSVLEGTAGLGMDRWMHIHIAISVSFLPGSLKYLEALCLTTLKSFSHLFYQSSEDYHFSTTALFGSKTKSLNISRHILISTSLHTSRHILGT